MLNRHLSGLAVTLFLMTAGCARKQAPAPPPAPAAKQNVFVLLAETNGRTGRITVTNAAGAQELTQSHQAVRVERSDVPPGAPFVLDDASVRRTFGEVLDALPAEELHFVLYFDEGKDELNAASQAALPEIFRAVDQRHSTSVTVIGHTDTTGTRQFNIELGMRRAQQVAETLRARGLDPSNLFIASHGESDPVVETSRGVSEQRNRRVEVIVR